jgi:hypothetical protein
VGHQGRQNRVRPRGPVVSLAKLHFGRKLFGTNFLAEIFGQRFIRNKLI